MTLSDPDSVVSRARELDPAAGDPTINIAVTGPIDAESVDRIDGSYTGETAGALGRLAAAVAVGEEVSVHYPEPTLTADGPWLVLAPLSGNVSTVATGVGRVTVVLSEDSGETLNRLEDSLSALFDAARPSHDHYPVEEDSRGVFTTGMTTFSLDSVSVEDRVTVTFDVSTTPATRASVVEARFTDVSGVDSAAYEPVAGVERAAPSKRLRGAVEAAHRREFGDCGYDWLRSPGVFAAIPGGEKIALGPGDPDATEFTSAEYESCLGLLEAVVSTQEVVA